MLDKIAENLNKKVIEKKSNKENTDKCMIDIDEERYMEWNSSKM